MLFRSNIHYTLHSKSLPIRFRASSKTTVSGGASHRSHLPFLHPVGINSDHSMQTMERKSVICFSEKIDTLNTLESCNEGNNIHQELFQNVFESFNFVGELGEGNLPETNILEISIHPLCEDVFPETPTFEEVINDHSGLHTFSSSDIGSPIQSEESCGQCLNLNGTNTINKIGDEEKCSENDCTMVVKKSGKKRGRKLGYRQGLFLRHNTSVSAGFGKTNSVLLFCYNFE